MERSYRTLLGAIGAGLVDALSRALDDVFARYRDRKLAALSSTSMIWCRVP